MMNLRFLTDIVEVQLLSADLTGSMEALAKAGITIEQAVLIDELHLRFSVSEKELTFLTMLTQKRGEEIQVIHHKGLYHALLGMLKRPVLTFGLLAVLLFSLWVPTRILFVCVEGNDSVDSGKILEIAENCGVGFGTSRRELRSEKVKNALLSALPELQWAGVNTYGCTAIITVRERNQAQTESTEYQVSHIVAVRDGIIRDVTVLKGNSLCKPGQAVKAGEILVSGYQDCGVIVRAGRSEGEIYADTQRYLTAVVPLQYRQRQSVLASSKKYSLIIGKKRINLFKGSGISGTTCAKIYLENYLTLPGGFVLPVAIACEQWYSYDTEPQTIQDGEQILACFAADYLPALMTAGKIVESRNLFFHTDSHATLEGVYGCYEMIGIIRPEERLDE